MHRLGIPFKHKVDNPFKFGSELARGKYFVDRKTEREKLRKELKRGQRIVVYSARRYGKTTLIVNVLDDLEKEGCITAYLDVSTTPDKSLFIMSYRSLFIRPKSTKWFLGWLGRNIPKIKVSVGDLTFDFSGLSDKDVDQVFEKIINLPQELAKEENKRVIVALDEFHEIRGLDSVKTENMLRSRFQFHNMVSYVFSGSEGHILQDMFESSDKPFYKSAKMFELKKIPTGDYAAYIKNAFESSKIKIEDNTISEILGLTGSSTYYTQQLCHELWDYCKVNERPSVSAEDVSAAIEQVISNQSTVFEKTWEMLASTYRKLLIGIISEESPQVWSKEFLTKMRLSAGALDRAIKVLSEKYIIERDKEKVTTIIDPFFKIWLSRKLRKPIG